MLTICVGASRRPNDLARFEQQLYTNKAAVRIHRQSQHNPSAVHGGVGNMHYAPGQLCGLREPRRSHAKHSGCLGSPPPPKDGAFL